MARKRRDPPPPGPPLTVPISPPLRASIEGELDLSARVAATRRVLGGQPDDHWPQKYSEHVGVLLQEVDRLKAALEQQVREHSNVKLTVPERMELRRLTELVESVKAKLGIPPASTDGDVLARLRERMALIDQQAEAFQSVALQRDKIRDQVNTFLAQATEALSLPRHALLGDIIDVIRRLVKTTAPVAVPDVRDRSVNILTDLEKIRDAAAQMGEARAMFEAAEKKVNELTERLAGE